MLLKSIISSATLSPETTLLEPGPVVVVTAPTKLVDLLMATLTLYLMSLISQLLLVRSYNWSVCATLGAKILGMVIGTITVFCGLLRLGALFLLSTQTPLTETSGWPSKTSPAAMPTLILAPGKTTTLTTIWKCSMLITKPILTTSLSPQLSTESGLGLRPMVLACIPASARILPLSTIYKSSLPVTRLQFSMCTLIMTTPCGFNLTPWLLATISSKLLLAGNQSKSQTSLLRSSPLKWSVSGTPPAALWVLWALQAGSLGATLM